VISSRRSGFTWRGHQGSHALHALRMAALTGYKDVEGMQANPDLEWLREVARPQVDQIVKMVSK